VFGARCSFYRLLAALAVTCVMLAAVAAAAAAQQLRGVALHPQASDRSASAISQEFSMLQSAGANTIRFDVAWDSVEWTAKGVYDAKTLSWLDWVMAEAGGHGLKVVLDVMGTPCWASSAPATLKLGCSWGWWFRGVTKYPPMRSTDYADFVAYVAQRWRPYLAAIELWNEPNSTQFFVSPNPVRSYATLVRAAFPEVKAVTPDLPVLMSLGGTDTTWLSELYYLGVLGSYDGIAVHPYYQPTFAGLKAFRSYQTSVGDAAPLWVTEVGWSSTQYGLAGQASNVSSALQQLAALPYVSAVELYDMRDDGTNAADPEQNFGLIDRYFNPKPAWQAFVSELHALASAL
jgi:hypothetical protein